MLLFCLLFLQLNNLQVFQASKLNNKPGNSLTASSVNIQPRGQIVSRNGTVLAESVPVADQYHYLRQYPQGPLYADITGFSSLIYGNYGIEASYNKYLVAQPNPITSLSDIFSNNKKYVTNTVVLTVSTKDIWRAVAATFSWPIAEYAKPGRFCANELTLGKWAAATPGTSSGGT